jgi:hypothetical protein
LSHELVLQLRQQEAVPILEALGKWMRQTYIEVLPKSAIDKALACSIERWKQLMIYTTDGKLNIDNNPVENAIRPVAVGRKNYLFAYLHIDQIKNAKIYEHMFCRIYVTCKNINQKSLLINVCNLLHGELANDAYIEKNGFSIEVRRNKDYDEKKENIFRMVFNISLFTSKLTSRMV